MANNNRLTAQFLGFTPSQPVNGATTTLALAAAATWLTYGFAAPFGKTLSTVRAYISAVAGTLAAADVTCSLCSDSNGNPGTVLETHNCSSAPSAAGWYDWTGFTTALTAGAQYWLVFKNANGVPGTNNPTFQYASANSGLDQCLGGWSSVQSYGWWKKHSTNSGGAWGTAVTATAGWRVGYSDGSYDGFCVSSIAQSADLVYATNESGLKFTAPTGALINVIGVAMGCGNPVSTPSAAALFKLYNGADAAVLTDPIGGGQANVSQGWTTAYFTTAKQLTPGATIRVTLAEQTNSDASTKAYRLIEYGMDSDSNSQTLQPFAGTLGKTYWNGTAWTDTASSIFPFALIQDVQGEYSSQAAGPLCISHRRLVTVRGVSFGRRGVLPIAGAAPAPAALPITRFRPSPPRPPAERHRTVFPPGPATAAQVVIPITRRRIITAPATRNRPRRPPVIAGGSVQQVQQVLVHRPILVR